MNRFALTAVAAVAVAGWAAAGPIPTWGYKVYTPFAPTPIVSQGTGLAATDIVTISADDIEAALKGHVGDPSPLDSIQGGTGYRQVISGNLGVMFVNGTPTYYEFGAPDRPVYGGTYDSVAWGVTRDWTKAGDTWEVVGETFNGGGPWFGDNHAYGRSEDGRYIWNRYDVRLGADGSLALSMTHDVPANPRFVPEPGTLVIVGISAAGLLAAGWRKRFGK